MKHKEIPYTFAAYEYIAHIHDINFYITFNSNYVYKVCVYLF